MFEIGQDIGEVAVQGFGRRHDRIQAGVRCPEVPASKEPRGSFGAGKPPQATKRPLPEPPAPILFAAHTDGTGIQLFRAPRELDLEGIAARRKDAPYRCDERCASWVKIKNPHYSPVRGRHKLFGQAK